MSKVIVVTGTPASGKTTFVRAISKKFALPIVAKDEIKEILFDSLGVVNRDFGRKLGGASFDLIYSISDQLMQSKVPHIIEGNFNPMFANDVLNEKFKTYNCKALQFNFFADSSKISDRFQERWENRLNDGGRHEGHFDNENYNMVKEIGGKMDALSIMGNLIEVDTTNFDSVNYDYLHREIKAFLNKK